jgi:DNA-binding NarL/FixJ family response regulator
LAQSRHSERLVRLVIADDHPILRDGLRRLLEAEDLEVLGEASDGAEAVTLARQLKPDILLLDTVMPSYSCMDTLRELSNPTNPTPVPVILFTAAIEKSGIVEALQLGARGIVLKDSGTQVLLKAIQTVNAGEYWVDREQVSNVAQYLRDEARREAEARRKEFGPNFGLTPREVDTVSLVVAGYSDKEIAMCYMAADATFKHHLRKIFDKLGVSTRLELALFAVNEGLPLKPIV